ncbi:ribonuclease III [Orientia chuto str. Dubai]|uniref:Ribonuclease 3 n=1 Tax=Orientia chuto str. Dubai TaxID=1359168 RepID=A0A0F3MNW4_9RICK|nr:ribonuclease III [Candidatus Orientia mediorientalis]KJV56279.1 ribonuclease III [Orientia chuto str. Dubai]
MNNNNQHNTLYQVDDYTKLSKLQSKINYNFKNIDLLIEALTHPSINQYGYTKNYQRLEFLGDAVLNLVISEVLFTDFNCYNEGKLAKSRASLVCNESICQVAQKINLHEYIIMTVSEEKCGGKSNKNNIENAMEAIIGAIYLDGGICAIKDVIKSLWQILIKDNELYLISDPKSALQEWTQSKNLGIPTYKLSSKTGKAHNPLFEVMVKVKTLTPQYGKGKTLKIAQKNAAQLMLSTILID